MAQVSLDIEAKVASRAATVMMTIADSIAVAVLVEPIAWSKILMLGQPVGGLVAYWTLLMQNKRPMRKAIVNINVYDNCPYYGLEE